MFFVLEGLKLGVELIERLLGRGVDEKDGTRIFALLYSIKAGKFIWNITILHKTLDGN